MTSKLWTSTRLPGGMPLGDQELIIRGFPNHFWYASEPACNCILARHACHLGNHAAPVLLQTGLALQLQVLFLPCVPPGGAFSSQLTIRHAARALQLLSALELRSDHCLVICRWVWICIGALIVANIVFHIVLLAAAQFLGPYGGTANIQSEESLAQREYAKHGGEGYNPVSLQVDEV